MDKQEFFTFLSKSIGNKVELFCRSGINKGTYPSSLMDLKDGFVGVAQPMHKGSWVQMSGLELILIIKSDGNMIEAPIVSRGTTFEGLIPILWVEIVGDVNRVQRRSFVRIPCRLEASCCFLEIYSDTRETKPDPDSGSYKGWVPIIVNNVSLGGIAATIKRGFDNNFYKKGRYLLAINFGGGLMFLNLLLRNISNNNHNEVAGAFAFGGLSVYQDKMIGNYVRQQELAGKNR